MKKTYLLMASLLMAGGAVAQLQPNVGGELTALLPDGVKANIDQTKMFQTAKNLTVAGSPEKGYYAFFAASDADHGEELWVTDGTVDGTHMVMDINPGVASSDVNWLTRFNDKVVFSATDGLSSQLWISDGTEEGTFMVKQIHELDNADPKGFCQLNESQFVFFATDFESEQKYGAAQQWLWVSDGTEEGTALVAEVDSKYPGSENLDHRYGATVRSGRKVFFKGDAADKTGRTYGEELWVTDGTPAGTFMVKDINEELNTNDSVNMSTNSGAISYIMNVENRGVFFKAWSLESGNEPWFSDGTEAGTYEIYDTNPTKNAETGIGNGGGVTMVGEIYKGQVLFRGFQEETGIELGVTTCEKGNFRQFDIATLAPSNDHSSYPDHGVVFDDRYMFCANPGTDPNIEGHYGGELHWFDNEKVQVQYDFAPGTGCDWVKELTVCGGSLYWWNEGNMDGTTATDTKLVRLNAWDAKPEIITNIDAGGDKVSTLRNMNGSLLFTSKVNNQVYCYTYRQEGYDPNKNPDVMEPTYGDEQSAVEGVEADAIEFATYPNPAVNAFRVKGLDATSFDLRMYDMNGRLVRSIDNMGIGVKVDVSDLPAGRYEVTATAEKTGTVSSSLVVNK